MTLAETLAAKAATTEECIDPVVVDDEVVVDPAAEPEPLAITTQGFPLVSPALHQSPQTVKVNSGEAFGTLLQASPHFANLQPSPVGVPGAYVAVDGSRRGYQWSGGIMRPDVFGRYTARNADEAEALATLATAGTLVAQASGSIFPINL